MATSAPSPASFSVIARPIPVPPPVTSAALPLSFTGPCLLSSDRKCQPRRRRPGCSKRSRCKAARPVPIRRMGAGARRTEPVRRSAARTRERRRWAVFSGLLDLEHHFPAARGFRRLDRLIVIIQAEGVGDHRGHVHLPREQDSLGCPPAIPHDPARDPEHIGFLVNDVVHQVPLDRPGVEADQDHIASRGEGSCWRHSPRSCSR